MKKIYLCLSLNNNLYLGEMKLVLLKDESNLFEIGL